MSLSRDEFENQVPPEYRGRPLTLDERIALDDMLAPPFPSPDLVAGASGATRNDQFIQRMDSCRAVVIGSAVGDALGAPFEFGPAGAFSARFGASSGENEMIGNGLWAPGEFTDDTQMAILEAESILDVGWIDEWDIWERFQIWRRSGPKDIGIQTQSVLTHPIGYPAAAEAYYRANPDSAAGNGSLMRASFAAARWSWSNPTGTAEIARRLSRITHGDPAAGEGRALFQMMVHNAVLYRDPFHNIEQRLAFVKDGEREMFDAAIGPNPDRQLGNGSVWGCLRDAVDAVRGADGFEEALRRACDVGQDVDTVAAVAGGLAGAIWGIDAIPERWIEPLHGTVAGEHYNAERLISLTDRLVMASIPLEKLRPTRDFGRDWLPDRGPGSDRRTERHPE